MVCNYEKWSGLGNDFILMESLPPKTSPSSWCDGSRGLTADGLLLVQPPQAGPAQMVIYNRDGSRPEMCGNGLRCAVRYLLEAGHDLRAGIRSDVGRHQVVISQGHEVTVTVGEPHWWGRTGDHVQTVQGLEFYGVDVGNPHAVFFGAKASIDLVELGRLMQSDSRFPEGTNVHLVDGRGDVLRVRHFERGVGVTQACGTGAAAVAWAAVAIGRSSWPVRTQLPGGGLYFDAGEEGQLWMTGPAERLSRGHLDLG